MPGMLGIGTTAVGGIYNEIGNARQNRQQREMMGLQYGNQRKLNQQGHRMQMDIWNKTNYGAQVDHMKEAGLNPALMYGSAGQGGQTGSQGGGSAGSGSAPKAPVMDMSNMLMDAQIENIKKDTQKKEVERQNLAGETPESEARIDKLIAEKLGVDANKAKVIQETLNLKTVDEWNAVKQGLDQLKLDKKFTGSQIIDLMSTVGLDPVNNEDDMKKMQLILGVIVGSKVAKNIFDIIKPKVNWK